MVKEFDNHIIKNLPFLKESKLLIAISGGLDSVVLTHLCKALNLNIALAHCNFKLRGKESDEDEAFVLSLAETLELEVFVQCFDTKAYAETEKLSIQMAARELRYEWFDDLLKDLNFDYLLTAHHTDDNLETFLINLSRGTGLKGLTGIPEVNGQLVRPLLAFSRDQLENYAKNNSLKWREDSSNTSDKYLRNKLRHDVIPVLKDMTPELLQNFKKTIEHLKDSNSIINESVSKFADKTIETFDGQQLKYKISELKNKNNPKAYLYELFHNYGFTQWNDILDLLDAQSGKQVFSQEFRLVKDREHLILNELSIHTEEVILIKESDGNVEIPNGTLLFNEMDALGKQEKTTIFVDKEKLKFPLLLRRWKDGDVFYPSGMNGKKKLSKYFKDEKLSLVDKENVWLLTSENEIVWVIGMRGDERYKPTSKTSNILKIKLSFRT